MGNTQNVSRPTEAVYVEDTILLRRQGPKLCIKYIYFIFADVTSEPRGQVRKKKEQP